MSLGNGIKLSEYRVRQIVKEEIEKYNREKLAHYNKEIKKANDAMSIKRDKAKLKTTTSEQNPFRSVRFSYLIVLLILQM